MKAVAHTTIEISSAVPGDPARYKTAVLLKYPRIDECRSHEQTEQPLEFEWDTGDGITPVTTPFYVTELRKDGLQHVHGRTGRRGSPHSLKVVVTYNYDGVPMNFRYLNWA